MPNYSTGLLNELAPHITELTECNMPDLSEHRDASQKWLSLFILNSAFSAKYPDPFHKYTIAFLRKSEYAFKNYFVARDALFTFVRSPILTSDNPSALLAIYFECLHHIEMSISLIDQAYCVFTELIANGKFWNKGDGSILEKINLLHNHIKHAEDRITNALTKPGYHIWLTNSSVCCEKGSISYSEITQPLLELAENASYYCNPRKVLEDIQKQISEAPPQTV
jgi:hypothetical protein